jgi:hypothetical protein
MVSFQFSTDGQNIYKHKFYVYGTDVYELEPCILLSTEEVIELTDTYQVPDSINRVIKKHKRQHILDKIIDE